MFDIEEIWHECNDLGFHNLVSIVITQTPLE